MLESIIYGLIGGTGALSIVIFLFGFATYIARLGTVRREDGFENMQWGVALAITSIILIGVLNFLRAWLFI